MASASPKRGVLLINLGTPDTPTEDAIRRYLKEFLSDPRVVTLPQWLWQPILNGIILKTRPARLVERYREIWTAPPEAGGDSPIRYFGQRLAEAVGSLLNSADASDPFADIQVRSAMTYGTPSIGGVLQSMIAQGVTEVLAIPLFPQYTEATTGAVKAAINGALTTLGDATAIGGSNQPFELSLIDDYHDHPDYVGAICHRLAPHLDALRQPDCRLLLSYHGIPKSQARGDPYLEQCRTSAELIARRLDLDQQDWQMTFQSRFGPMPWLTPYTDETVKALAKDGLRHLIVACPGFAVDCLETLEEICEENKGYFIESGGQQFTYVPALNADSDHAFLMASLARQYWSNG